MNDAFFCAARWHVIAALVFLAVAVHPQVDAAEKRPASKSEAAQQLVTQALLAELAGHNSQRHALIQQAVRLDSNCRQAQWQAGRVRQGHKWLTISEAQQQTLADRRWQQYQRLRGRLRGQLVGIDAHLALARWCGVQGLNTESRYHWYQVLSRQPKNAEALARLGAVWHQGRLRPQEEVLQKYKDTQRARFAVKDWIDRLERWAAQIAQREKNAALAEKTLQELREVDDPHATTALGLVLLEHGGEFAQQAVALVGERAEHEATKVLARVAVLSPDADIRFAAAEQLRRRPLHDYAPLLLLAMEKPLESWFRIHVSPHGHVSYHHELYREGAAADKVLSTRRSLAQLDVPGASMFVRSIRFGDHFRTATPAEEAIKAADKRQRADNTSGQFANAAEQVNEQVQQANAQTQLLNQRIRAMLTTITQQDFGADPQHWWDWWKDYNEVYLEGEKPIIEAHFASHKSVEVIPTIWMSCFLRGTKVWTNTGLVSIEKIEPGELVLAQDVNTGELAFKPVLATTVRPPSAMLRLTVEGEQITTTRGHPFWASGTGWRMAKLLKEGQRVRSLQGSRPIERFEELPDNRAYNLVVGDFHSYFVGERGLLVHDNTFRRPTTALLPGLLK